MSDHIADYQSALESGDERPVRAERLAMILETGTK